MFARSDWCFAHSRGPSGRGARLCPPRTKPQHGKKGGGWGIVPRRSEDVRAQRLVLCTQSRSVGPGSAAVSAEDQPQHGKKGGGWGIVPRRSEDVRAQRLVLYTVAVRKAGERGCVRRGPAAAWQERGRLGDSSTA